MEILKLKTPKLILSISTLLILLPNVVTAEEEICIHINRIIQESNTFFNKIRGSYDQEFEEYQATYILPNSPECIIESDENGASYNCEWTNGINSSNVDESYIDFLRSVKNCLGPTIKSEKVINTNNKRGKGHHTMFKLKIDVNKDEHAPEINVSKSVYYSKRQEDVWSIDLEVDKMKW